MAKTIYQIWAEYAGFCGYEDCPNLVFTTSDLAVAEGIVKELNKKDVYANAEIEEIILDPFEPVVVDYYVFLVSDKVPKQITSYGKGPLEKNVCVVNKNNYKKIAVSEGYGFKRYFVVAESYEQAKQKLEEYLNV